MLALPGLVACGAELDRPVDTSEVVTSEICVAPPGMGAPSTIHEVVQLLNALPGPVSVACLVRALDRPLSINSTSGKLSAQPAGGVHDPRIFIFLDGLSMSIVPAGAGRSLLELGQYDTPEESLKGELHMPVDKPVSQDQPYEHLRYIEGLTFCGLCHRDERLAPEIGHPNAYISGAFRPKEAEMVPLEAVRAEHEACVPGDDPERCAIYSALFDHGPVLHQDFSATLKTIFDD